MPDIFEPFGYVHGTCENSHADWVSLKSTVKMQFRCVSLFDPRVNSRRLFSSAGSLDYYSMNSPLVNRETALLSKSFCVRN